MSDQRACAVSADDAVRVVKSGLRGVGLSQDGKLVIARPKTTAGARP